MTLSFKTGRDAAFYIAKGSNNEISDVALVEVDLTSEGYPEHTVYEIDTAAYRYLNDDEVPVIQFDTGGNSEFQAVTPVEIQYVGARFFLASARGATDVGRVHSGHYLTLAQYLGALNFTLDEEWRTDEVFLLGDDGPSTLLMTRGWSGSVEGYWCKTPAIYESNMAGHTNNDFRLTHEKGGTEGNLASIELVDPGAAHANTDVAVFGNAITVTLAYADGAITTTGAQLVAALNAADAVRALGITASYKAGNDGSGLVEAITPHEHLSGGLDQVDYGSETAKVVGVFYKDYDNDVRQEGFCVITNFKPDLDPNKAIRTRLDFKSAGPLYRRSG